MLSKSSFEPKDEIRDVFIQITPRKAWKANYSEEAMSDLLALVAGPNPNEIKPCALVVGNRATAAALAAELDVPLHVVMHNPGIGLLGVRALFASAYPRVLLFEDNSLKGYGPTMSVLHQLVPNTIIVGPVGLILDGHLLDLAETAPNLLLPDPIEMPEQSPWSFPTDRDYPELRTSYFDQ